MVEPGKAGPGMAPKKRKIVEFLEFSEGQQRQATSCVNTKT